MICPNCAREMEHLERHGVTLDRCEVCGGIWLDRGELETLIEAVRPPVVLANPEPRPVKSKPPKPSRHPREDSRENRRVPKAAPKHSKGKRYEKKYSTSARIRYLLKEILD